MNSIQNFFNNQPVAAGIILFFIIFTIANIIFIIYYFAFARKSKKRGFDLNTMQIDPNASSKSSINSKKLDPNFTYFLVNLNNENKLYLENLSDNSINKQVNQLDIMNILNNKKQKLVLPEKLIEISKQDENGKNVFKPAHDVKGVNAFVFNAFLRFMQHSENSWLISKFR